ncbi:MAG: hypothetical protein R3Y05_03890 [bacterium]
MNKQKLNNRKQSAKNKKIRKKETEDLLGVRKRRKGDKPELDIEVFYIIKAVLIVATILSYFFLSSLLLPLFIGFSSLYILSFWVERRLNRSYNSENKKSIFKMDAGLAFITIIVSISTTFYSYATMMGSKFSSFSSYFTRLMSLSTGSRGGGNKNFGIGGKPEGFVKPEGMTKPSGGQRPQRPDFDISDLPIEYAFNQILSSIVQFLILSVIIISSITVILYFRNKYIKIKKINIKQNDKNDWSFSKEDLMRLLEEQV